jgi:glycosyltransferase involved in cell wall biosynthesis
MAEAETAELGIGIITYNRLPALQGCVQGVQSFTRAPYRLVVADDGSEDRTAEWARGEGLTVITGHRRGVAWNKNRALYYLLERTACDPILLLEDDCWPVAPGWEESWIEAGRLWGHVNWAPPGHLIVAGAGTPEAPYRSADYTAQCTVTARSALEAVGYLDTRFQGWGWEHVEWTGRFGRHLADLWGPPDRTVPSLPDAKRLSLPSFGSYYNEEDIERNGALMAQMAGDPMWRPPWRTPEEEAAFHEEQSDA